MNDTFRDYVKRNRLFILGAGFSAAAGIPVMGKLLQATMNKFSCECSGIYSQVEDHTKVAFGLGDAKPDYACLNFPELCTFLDFVELREFAGGERWSDKGCRERLALKHYLSKTIAALTPASGVVPGLYRRFARQLHPGDIVMTFNWDGLLEIALRSSAQPFDYNFAQDRIQISKMHGSVNWRIGLDFRCAQRFEWKPSGFREGSIKEEVYFSPDLLDFDAWRVAEPISGEVEPFLVLPGFGKAYDIRAISTLWYRPETVFSFTKDIYIIGLALNPDDFFVRSFLLATLPHLDSFHSLERTITIINPDERISENYKFIKKGVKFVQEPFGEEHVEAMENSVGTQGARGAAAKGTA